MKTADFALLVALFLSGNVYADGGDSGAKVAGKHVYRELRS